MCSCRQYYSQDVSQEVMFTHQTSVLDFRRDFSIEHWPLALGILLSRCTAAPCTAADPRLISRRSLNHFTHLKGGPPFRLECLHPAFLPITSLLSNHPSFRTLIWKAAEDPRHRILTFGRLSCNRWWRKQSFEPLHRLIATPTGFHHTSSGTDET